MILAQTVTQEIVSNEVNKTWIMMDDILNGAQLQS